MAFVALAILKFILYCLVCVQAPRLLSLATSDRTSFALIWASARLVLGVVCAYPAFMAVAWLQNLNVPFEVAYVAVLIALRYALWQFICEAISQSTKKAIGKVARQKWVLLGVAASFTVDGAAILAGADNFKFVC